MRCWSGGRMDDLALLDLLECPVCFERLDGTAKVLPCQHTFCKPCLQQISHSHKEVRCPECRSAVTGSIDDLPVNLLLVRLLDGIRYGQTNARVTPPQTAQPPADQHQGNWYAEPVKSHSGLVKTLSPAHSPLEQVPCARALYTYSGQKPGDLSFRKGDIILLHQQVDENWFYGEISGACGIFPLGFVHVIHHLPQPPPLCKALYDFTLQETEQPVIKNILPFVKNNILKVIRRVDENWAEGKLGERVGIFPISFVEMNSTAKQLLSLKRVDVKSVQSHSSPMVGNPCLSLTQAETGNPHVSLTHVQTGNPRLSLTHADTGNPHVSLTQAETGNPGVSLTHADTGNPRVSLTHADTGNPRLSLTHAETGNPRLSLTYADTGNPRLSLTYADTGNPRLSLTHAETGNPRLSLTHAETGNPRLSLTHADTGNPRLSLTHTEMGNRHVSLTHTETGNPHVSLTRVQTGNPHVLLTRVQTGNPRLSLTHTETGNPRLSLTHTEMGNPHVSLTHTETGNPHVTLTHVQTGNPHVSLTHTETGNPHVSLTHVQTGNPHVSLTHTKTGNPHVSLTHTETGNPRVALTHAEMGKSRVTLTHTQTGKTGSKDSRCHANAVNTLTRMCQPPPSRRSLHISLPVLISSSNPAVLAQITEGRATPTQMLHGMLEVGVSDSGTRSSSSQYHPEMGHPGTQVPRPAAGVTEITRPHRAVVPASGQEEAMVGITLPSRMGPYGQQDAVTSPPRLSGGSLARHVDSTGYRPNVHRPTLAVPPVRSQNSNGRCVPAVVIKAQPYSSCQLPQRADSHTIHSSPLASTCRPSLPTRPVPTRPMPTTAPPPPPPRAVRQVQQPLTASPGGIIASTSTPTHANNQDRSCLNKAGCGPGVSLPPSWFTTPRFQPTTSPKPEQAREEDASNKTQAPTVSHSRAASCPITSQEKVEVLHQKTGSWDSCYPCTPPSPPHSSTVEEQPVPAPTPSTCFNRCRAVLWLPARGAAEPGDVMLVHGRRPDGCYQDNHTERGNTGLFTGNGVGGLR